jgi:PTS system ascorbate-specific IIA component
MRTSPVNFGSEANDPVKLVISGCGIDHDSHIEMLKALSEFIMVDENQNLLKSSNSVEEILQAFQ